MDQSKIRNVAIIAHIDHGKTTLVDFLLKQSHVFRENSEEMAQTLIMDSNELERERGITILAKNTAIDWNGYRINIIDTPGHADFGGEVERTLTMADGCILLVDAQEGPMPQTRFVLQKALELNLKPIVVVNKIDKLASRIAETVDGIHSLFLELARDESQLEFPILYAIGREGKAWNSQPTNASEHATLEPILEQIIKFVPPPDGDEHSAFQMRIVALDFDSFSGRYAIGKINRGKAVSGMRVCVCAPDGDVKTGRIEKIFRWAGLNKTEVSEAETGDIVALTGLPYTGINSTVCDPGTPEPLPPIAIEEPTLKLLVGPNTSPFAGRDGSLLTSRQIRERLEHELETNVSMRMEQIGEKFMVSGRGELHLSVLLETMRREGFELEVGKPTVISKEENGIVLEPIEEVTIDVPDEHKGIVLTEMAKRRAEMVNTFPRHADNRIIYKCPTRNIVGLRTSLMTLTRGSCSINSRFLLFGPQSAAMSRIRGGALIAHETGKAVAFGLDIAQGRGTTFIEPGTEVYEGMIVGENAKDENLEINVAKGKELTNMRSKSSDGLTILTPPHIMTLEQALEWVGNDELLEITPKNLRLRKKLLKKSERRNVTTTQI